MAKLRRLVSKLNGTLRRSGKDGASQPDSTASTAALGSPPTYSDEPPPYSASLPAISASSSSATAPGVESSLATLSITSVATASSTRSSALVAPNSHAPTSQSQGHGRTRNTEDPSIATSRNNALRCIRMHDNNPDTALRFAATSQNLWDILDLLSHNRLKNISASTYEYCLQTISGHLDLQKELFKHASQYANAKKYNQILCSVPGILENCWDIFPDILSDLSREEKGELLRPAARNNCQKTVKWLMKNDAAAMPNDLDDPILVYAVLCCSLPIMILLLEQGADVDASPLRAPKRNPLLTAAFHGDEQKVTHLLDYGAEIEATDSMRRTALHLAAKRNHQGVLRCLLERGASHIAKDCNGDQPVHLAGEEGNAKIFNLLRQRAGLPPVSRAQAPAPRRSGGLQTQGGRGRKLGGRSGSGSGSGSSSNRYEETEWPPLASQARSGELDSISPAEARYWN